VRIPVGANKAGIAASSDYHGSRGFNEYVVFSPLSIDLRVYLLSCTSEKEKLCAAQ
jgi:hypothetical protein